MRSSYESSSLESVHTEWSIASSSSTYTIRRVFVNPEPCCHPVTMTTVSPVFRNPRFLPKFRPYWTRRSTSFSQSVTGGSGRIKKVFSAPYCTLPQVLLQNRSFGFVTTFNFEISIVNWSWFFKRILLARQNFLSIIWKGSFSKKKKEFLNFQQ